MYNADHRWDIYLTQGQAGRFLWWVFFQKINSIVIELILWHPCIFVAYTVHLVMVFAPVFMIRSFVLGDPPCFYHIHLSVCLDNHNDVYLAHLTHSILMLMDIDWCKLGVNVVADMIANWPSLYYVHVELFIMQEGCLIVQPWWHIKMEMLSTLLTLYVLNFSEGT